MWIFTVQKKIFKLKRPFKSNDLYSRIIIIQILVKSDHQYFNH